MKSKESVTPSSSSAQSVSSVSGVVSNGDTVSVHYVGKFTDGKVFDTSRESIAKEAGIYTGSRQYVPLEFTVGAGQMIPGFDKALVGMKVGEKKSISLPPAEAYGEHDPKKIMVLDKKMYTDAGIEPKVGLKLAYGNEGASQMGVITAINGTGVSVDFNSDMAGKTLNFEIELVSIKGR